MNTQQVAGHRARDPQERVGLIVPSGHAPTLPDRAGTKGKYWADLSPLRSGASTVLRRPTVKSFGRSRRSCSYRIANASRAS